MRHSHNHAAAAGHNVRAEYHYAFGKYDKPAAGRNHPGTIFDEQAPARLSPFNAMALSLKSVRAAC